ncbi:MAG TPA: cell envelope integrity protein TolA [Xanthomonadales bacterium]|nr:cell envelope integrity protein TolA [Xanthomonadales bacterium]
MQELWSRTRAFGLSIGVHLLAAALIVLGTRDWRPFRPPDLQGLMIEAVIVDMSAVREAQREADLAEQRELDRQRRQSELEAQRERERLAAEEAERQRQRERVERQREEDLRLQQLRQQQERERLEEERARQKELEQIREQRAAAERERKIEEERLKQLQARNEAEAEAARQAEAEEALRQKMAREQAQFQAGRLASLNDQYHLAIQALVTQNWLRPPTTRAGLRCTVRIVQIPGGEVISANIVGGCNADEVTRRSLIAAVERTGTLPYRGYEDVFQREIDFIFRYDGD